MSFRRENRAVDRRVKGTCVKNLQEEKKEKGQADSPRGESFNYTTEKKRSSRWLARKKWGRGMAPLSRGGGRPPGRKTMHLALTKKRRAYELVASAGKGRKP